MGALLDSGLVGNIGLKHLKVIKEDTINKWDKLGFLDGLKGHVKENMAQLYENQASHLINEAAATDSSGSFETVVFPIVRRVFSKLLANDLVSVQAINLPIGKLFYFIPKIQGYDQGQDPTAGGTHLGPIGAVGGANQGDGYTSNDKNLYDRFYEGNEPSLDPPGLFDYSKGRFSAVTVTPTTVQWVAGQLTNTAYAAGEYRKVLIAPGVISFSDLMFILKYFTASLVKKIGKNRNVLKYEDPNICSCFASTWFFKSFKEYLR